MTVLKKERKCINIQDITQDTLKCLEHFHITLFVFLKLEKQVDNFDW